MEQGRQWAQGGSEFCEYVRKGGNGVTLVVGAQNGQDLVKIKTLFCFLIFTCSVQLYCLCLIGSVSKGNDFNIIQDHLSQDIVLLIPTLSPKCFFVNLNS